VTAIRLALTELRRLTTSRLGRLAVFAMILVPSLYGGLYLYANKDPYAAMKNVPAAVVIEDQGTTLATGEHLQVGDTVAKTLLDSKSFAWSQVDRAAAARGLRDGRYDFVLLVPPSFSADLASSADLKPRQAMLELETNDANGYLTRTIANQVVAQVTKSVAAQVSTTAASRLLEGFSTIHARISTAADGAAQLAAGADKAKAGTAQLASGADQLAAGEKKLVDGTDQLASGAATLASGLGTMKSQTASMPSQTQALADGARQVANGNAQIAAVGQQVATASQQLVTDMTAQRGALAERLIAAGFTPDQVAQVLSVADQLATPVTSANAKVQDANTKLGQLSAGAGQVADGAGRLAAAAPALVDGISQASAGASQLGSGAQQLRAGQHTAYDGATALASGAHTLDGGLGELGTGAHQLADGLRDGLRSIPDPSAEQRRAVAQTLGNPVGVHDVSQASAADYGAGLAPFFMSLALWIGGFVLFTRVRPLSTRALAAGQPAWRISAGGWLAPALLGVGQAVFAWLIIVFGVGVTAAHPVLLLLWMAVVSMTFMGVIHALMARFGLVGQFLALVVMVLQLVSAGGTFPWQTLPGPLQALHHVLPMSYAVDGIRRLMYGGALAHLWVDWGVLLAYAVGALLVGSYAARRAGTWTAARIKPEVTAA